MTPLDELIAKAFASQGAETDVNKVYLEFLRSPLFVPVEKARSDAPRNEEEPFKPLFAKVAEHFYMLAFDTLERLQTWAGEKMDLIDYVEISGRDVTSGIGNEAFLGLNPGTSFYKEFSAEEIKRLKTIVARLEQWRQG